MVRRAVHGGRVAGEAAWVAVVDDLVRILWGAAAVLLGLVWRNLHWRLKQHEERMAAIDQSIMYLREQGHTLRNLLPNPLDLENRRREDRQNFDKIFTMLREIEARQNEMNGELRAKRGER